MKRYDLYFGRRAGKTHELITHSSFRQFCRDYIDPRFPGYTVASGEGSWRGQPEECFIVTLIAGPEAKRKLDQIAEAYNRRYHQEATLLTVTDLESAELVGIETLAEVA